MSKDNINPSHYKDGTSLECIDVMCLIFGKRVVCYFCLCNAFKYMWRYKHKNGSEDLEKAHWYIDWAKEYIAHRADSQVQEDVDKIENLFVSIVDSYVG